MNLTSCRFSRTAVPALERKHECLAFWLHMFSCLSCCTRAPRFELVCQVSSCLPQVHCSRYIPYTLDCEVGDVNLHSMMAPAVKIELPTACRCQPQYSNYTHYPLCSYQIPAHAEPPSLPNLGDNAKKWNRALVYSLHKKPPQLCVVPGTVPTRGVHCSSAPRIS